MEFRGKPLETEAVPVRFDCAENEPSTSYQYQDQYQSWYVADERIRDAMIAPCVS